MSAPDAESKKQPSGSEFLPKHRWKIVGCTVVGIAAFVLIFAIQRPLYQSEAKLMVRYIVDRSTVDDVESVRVTTSASGGMDAFIMNAEVEILKSWDLAWDAARAVARSEPTTMSQNQSAEKIWAIALDIHENLKVTGGKDSNVVTISYVNADANVPAPRLREFVRCYFQKHLKVHRPARLRELEGGLDAAGNQLYDTEARLKEIKQRFGLLSVSQSSAEIAAALARTQQELDRAGTEVSEQQAVVETLKAATGDTTSVPNSSGDFQARLASELVKLKALEARSSALLALYKKYGATSDELTKVGPQLESLERQRELQAAAYSKWQSKLEKAKIDEKLLETSEMPNISVVQEPSPGVRL